MPRARTQPKLSSALPIMATSALAIAIFIADYVTPVDVVFATLYVVVVLLAARLWKARGVLLAAAGCVALTVLRHLLAYANEGAADASNVLISIAAIGVTTILALQSQRAETRLREKANLLDLTHDTIFVRGMDDVITYWNRGAQELYGWTMAEAVGRVTHELLQTTFPRPLEAINAELLRTGRWEGTLIHVKRDGARLTVASRWSLQRDRQGRPALILETNNDITERTAAEALLRDSEERWKAVFQNNPTMFFIVDAAGEIVSVNPFGADQLGYTVEELIGSHVQQLFHETDRDVAVRYISTCLERPGQAASWELRKIRKDGQVLWVRETARAMTIDQRLVVLIVCENITERRRAEYLTSHVFESSPDGMSIIGRDYRIQRANRSQEHIFQIPADSIVGKHVADLVGAEYFEQTSKPNLDRCFGGEDVALSGWVSTPRGREYRWTSYWPLRPYSEQVEAALVITRDLTDHMLASEGLRTAQAELAHVNRVATMGQLTASVAHEVNQPIAAAVINAQAGLRWLSMQPPDLEEVQNALSRILESGARARDVIGRIRALIKKAPPNKLRFDFNDAVRDVVALTRSEAQKHGVVLELQLSPDMPPVDGDRVQLQQVILNLIMNAIEAMSEVEDARRELQLRTEPDGDFGVTLTVSDTGPGLDPQAALRLFEPFYSTKADGMGMGLAICRSIVEAHGGKLSAAANEPRGAAFELQLPWTQPEQLPAARAGQMPA